MFRRVFLPLLLPGVLGWIGQAGSGAQAARESKDDAVPSSWEKVVPAQFGGITEIFVRDGYLVWMEHKLNPETRLFRAQGHWYRLYRRKLDGSTVETLHAPEDARSDGPACGVGEGGIVAWHDRGRDVRLFVPSMEPVRFAGDQPDHSHDTPLRIYRNALLCRTTFAVEEGVTLIPLKEGQPQYARRQVIVPWQEDVKQNTSFQGDFFFHGRHVAFTKRPRTRKNYAGAPQTVLWDVKAEREVWTARGWPIGMDGSFVYTVPGGWYYGFDNVERRPLDGRGEGESLVLPWPATVLVDFEPPKLLALFKRNSAFVFAALDLQTGAVREFDWQSTQPSGPQRRNERLTEPIYVAGRLAAGDVRARVLAVATQDAVYRVPARDEEGQVPVKWVAGGAEKER